MQHFQDTAIDTAIDTERITRDELAELVRGALARFDRIERRLDDLEVARAQREEATRALGAAFSGVVAAIERLNAAS